MFRRTGFAVALAALLAAPSQFAWAQAADSKTSESLWNFYAGAGLGVSKVDNTICDGLRSIGISTQQNCDDKDTGWKVYAGWKPLKNFSFEAGYVDLGEMTAKGGNTNLKEQADGGFVAALAFLPGLERIGVFIKGGAFFYQAKLSGRFAGQSAGSIAQTLGAKTKEDETTGFYGFGLRLPVNEHLQIGVEYERFLDVGDDYILSDLTLYTAGAVWMF